MRVALLTREWPPEVYGGAGVHVEQLAAHLGRYAQVDVQCFGRPRAGAKAHEPPAELAGSNFALQTLGVDLLMASGTADPDIVHSHTWYANLGGHLAGLLHGVPHVVTAHSLEPRRPWKQEQLGGGYRISSWVERAAYAEASAVIAVSAGMRADVLDCYPFVDADRVHVVPNGIDTHVYRPTDRTEALTEHGVGSDRPFALFVGRITRQKGLAHLLRAADSFDRDIRLVVCASSPDTPELGAEVAAQIQQLKSSRGDDSVIWIQDQLPREQVIQFYSHAAVFVCPSVYEPQGIVNLEAMACETPVVASDVGGIPEVVTPGTGILVHYDSTDTGAFEEGLAAAVNQVVADPEACRAMGAAGRARAVDSYGWDAIARRTVTVYESVLGR